MVHAGFIYGLIAGWDVDKSLDLAAWAAAMVSQKWEDDLGSHHLRTGAKSQLLIKLAEG